MAAKANVSINALHGYTCIIGTDVQKCFKTVTIDYEQGILQTKHSGPIQFTMPLHVTIQLILDVFPSKTYIIPPRSQIVITCRTDLENELDGLVYEFMPFKAKLHKENGLIAVDALVTPTKENLPVRLLNLNNETVVIYPKTQLGILQKMHMPHATCQIRHKHLILQLRWI